MNEVMSSKGKEIKYVTVDLMEKKVNCTGIKENVSSGLFKGIESDIVNDKVIKTVVLTYDPYAKSTVTFSLDYFTVVSFEVCTSHRTIYFFRDTETDQKLALDEMLIVVNELRAAERMTTNKDIINIDTYTDIPEKLGGEVVTSIKRNYSARHSDIPHTTTSVLPVSHYTTPVVKKDGASYFTRKDKASYDALKKIRQKILQIREGSYSSAPLPEFESDIKEEDSTKKESTTTTLSENTVASTGEGEWDSGVNEWQQLGLA